MDAVFSRSLIEAPENSPYQYRYWLYRPSRPAQAMVVYLPHYGGTIDDWESSILPQRLSESGIASVVGLPVPEGTGYLTESALLALHAMLASAVQQAQILPTRLVLGGFSAGGVGAIRYTQATMQGSLPEAFRPLAVFAVDPPLDLRRWYRGMELIIQRNQPSPMLNEAHAILWVLKNTLGGSPDEVPEAYHAISPVVAFAEQGGNLKYLRDIPLRLYTEPDMHFWLESALDLYSLNALDAVFAINELKVMGNKDAELILTSGKGFRPDLGGIRMPHAWSIVDEPDLARWIEEKTRTAAV